MAPSRSAAPQCRNPLAVISRKPLFACQISASITLRKEHMHRQPMWPMMARPQTHCRRVGLSLLLLLLSKLDQADGKTRFANPEWAGKVVVFESTVFGKDLCLSDNWHGTLPRYIASVLQEQGTTVLAWDGFASLQGDDDCWVCNGGDDLMGRVDEPAGGRFKCREWFGRDGRQETADMAVFLACTRRVVQKCRGQTSRGDVDCPELAEPLSGDHIGLQWCHSQPWIRQPGTATVHFPVSKPLEERRALFGLDVVIDDHMYLKPTPIPALKNRVPNAHGRIICEPGKPRTNTLLYIGRVGSDQKGHVAFLETVNPRLLKGYRVAFYSGEAGDNAVAAKGKMMQIAASRGIDIEVNLDRVPFEELLGRACRSRGLIQYSKRDQNPRTVYEMMYAGLPAFVTSQAHTPEEFNIQPFVQVTNFTKDGQDTSAMNRDFANFLAMTTQPGIRDHIETFLRDAMRAQDIYGDLCFKMGLCI